MKFSVVVAATPTGGIGVNGSLPWRLRGDMAFFKQLTSTPHDRNVVIMGRKTWESIPSQFRPLAHRLNVILTRQPDALKQQIKETTFTTDATPSIVVATSLHEALDLLDTQYAGQVDHAFVIGGAQVYKEALQSPLCSRIYLTLVEPPQPLECDTFMSDIPAHTFRQMSAVEVDKLMPWALPLNRLEQGMRFEFQVYERCQHNKENERS